MAESDFISLSKSKRIQVDKEKHTVVFFIKENGSEFESVPIPLRVIAVLDLIDGRWFDSMWVDNEYNWKYHAAQIHDGKHDYYGRSEPYESFPMIFGGYQNYERDIWKDHEDPCFSEKEWKKLMGVVHRSSYSFPPHKDFNVCIDNTYYSGYHYLNYLSGETFYISSGFDDE